MAIPEKTKEEKQQKLIKNHQWFVWESEYPEEGSWLIRAKSWREAKAKLWHEFNDELRITPLTAKFATRRQIRIWNRSEL